MKKLQIKVYYNRGILIMSEARHPNSVELKPQGDITFEKTYSSEFAEFFHTGSMSKSGSNFYWTIPVTKEII